MLPILWYSVLTGAGSVVNSVHRRHTHTGGVQGGVREPHSGLDILLECMGYIINWSNPAQTPEFLGLIVDTLSMELRLPLDKL